MPIINVLFQLLMHVYYGFFGAQFYKLDALPDDKTHWASPSVSTTTAKGRHCLLSQLSDSSVTWKQTNILLLDCYNTKVFTAVAAATTTNQAHSCHYYCYWNYYYDYYYCYYYCCCC